MTTRANTPLACAATLLAACSSSPAPQHDPFATTGFDPASSTDTGMKLDVPDGVTSTHGDPDEPSDCADVEVTVDPDTPTIVLLVDQSTSMNTDFAGIDRWHAVYDTLMDPTDGLIARHQTDIRFGLTLYSSRNGFDGPACPLLVDIPPALSNYDAIDTVFQLSEPVEDTPTGESLALVATDLAAFPEPGPKAIVLATDGEPDTCAQPDPQDGQPEALAAATAAHQKGIETFILSVGDELGADHLQQMANAGVGLDPHGPTHAPYWQALDPAALADAFDDIIGGVVSCTFTLDGTVELADFCEGTVRLDGTPLPCPADWQLLDGQTLELLGDACDTLKDGDPHTVQATFPCGTVNVP